MHNTGIEIIYIPNNKHTSACRVKTAELKSVNKCKYTLLCKLLQSKLHEIK